jgi:glycosyltransferase involved in cell wall biosynthesis
VWMIGVINSLTKRKMKLIYCIAGTYNSGGMERVLINKANYLARCGHDVLIVTTDQKGRESFFSLDNRIRCYDLGINYEENNGRSVFNKFFYYPLKQFQHRKKLDTLLKQQKADVVISMFCNEVSFISKIADGSKKVLEVHFSKYKRLQYDRKGLWWLIDRIRARMDEHYTKGFDRFVVLTYEDKRYWGLLPNIVVIPNSISLIPTICAELTELKVIAVGRYTYQKGFDYLIDAWEILACRWPEWQLDIVGDGELREQLQRRINDKGLQKSVCLKLPTRHIEDVYSSASIFVMTSRYEGLPMVLLEAQAAGLPVVAFACKCGPKDIISDGENGFLVPEGDVKRLAQKLMLLMRDVALRKKMGERAREIAGSFTEEKVMAQWISLFKQLTNSK